MQTAEVLSNFANFEAAPDKLPVAAIPDVFANAGLAVDSVIIGQLLKAVGLSEVCHTVVSKAQMQTVIKEFFRKNDIESDLQTNLNVFDKSSTGKASLAEVVMTLTELGTPQHQIEDIISEL